MQLQKFDIKTSRKACVSTLVFIMLRHNKLEVGGKNGTRQKKSSFSPLPPQTTN
jgi:hypothetical protein